MLLPFPEQTLAVSNLLPDGPLVFPSAIYRNRRAWRFRPVFHRK